MILLAIKKKYGSYKSAWLIVGDVRLPLGNPSAGCCFRID